MAETNQEPSKRDPLAAALRHLRSAIDALHVYEAEGGQALPILEHAECAEVYATAEQLRKQRERRKRQ